MKCSKCSAEKCIDQFYKNDRTCKECRKAMVRANRLANVEHYREYDNARANRPDRVEKRRVYIKSDAGKASHNRSTKKYAELEPKRRRAHILVGNAVKAGTLTPQPCLMCGEKAVAHHPNYDAPLDVVWLCPSHHKQAHALVETS